MRIFFIISFLFLFANIVNAICLTELDAEIYGCIEIKSDKSKQKFCREKFGSDFKAYYTTNDCSKELEATTRGETYDPSNSGEDYEQVEAACMSYEQGQKRGCTFYQYDKAERYCAERYGHRYIPFIIEGKNCTKIEASRSRGEVDPKFLIEGLESDNVELVKKITMLELEGMNNSLGSFVYTKPNIDTEFYIGITKRVMAKMNMVNKKLYDKSHLNVQVVNPYTKKFLKFIFRYRTLLARLYKLYAYVAHQNHYVLNSYKFENLEYLDIKLRKDFALEVLAKVNFSAITVDNGKSLLIRVSEDEKQTYEYQAIQDPNSKVDYAKLVSYMGVRENLVNLWAVQKLSKKEILNSRVSSCGKGFLSFRPGHKGKMEFSNAMTSLQEFDVFYNDYNNRWADLLKQSKKANILNKSKAQKLIVESLYSVSEVKEFLLSTGQISQDSVAELKNLALKDSQMIISAESEAWDQFATYHFKTIVMTGDNVLNKWEVINRIWRDSYEKRVWAIQDTLIGAYVWMDDKTLEKVKLNIRDFIEKNFKDNFFKRTKANLVKALTNYNDPSVMSEKYIKEKMSSVAATAYTAAHAVLINDLLSRKLSLNNIKQITPISKEELVTFFNFKIDKDFYDVRFTMEKDPKKAKIVDEFFKRLGEVFVSETQSVIERISKSDKMTAAKIMMFEKNQFLSDKLRESAVIVAREFYLNYPFEVSTLRRMNPSNMYILDPQESERAKRIWRNTKRLHVDLSGSPIVLSNTEILNTFARMKVQEAIKQKRIKRQRERLFGKSSSRKGHNKDRLTTGEISRPLSVDEKGIITSPKGQSSIHNNKLIDLYIRSGNISELAQTKLRSAKREIIKYDDKQKREGTFISDNREFFYRVLESLDLAWVSYIDDRASTYYGSFIKSDADQKIIASHRVAKAYQMEPILRNELTWTERRTSFRHNGFNHYTTTESVTVSKPLLLKIAKSAYSVGAFELDISRTNELIKLAIDNAIKSVPEKLSKFCKANYLRYKKDSNFKDVFKSSQYIRATIKSSIGITKEQSEKYNEFDEGVRKDIRGLFESWNEDYIEPSLHILGTAAFISIGIMLIIGTSGLAAPGVMGTIYSVASTFLAVEFFISFPLVVGSLYSRINTHFIEVPAQLRFQKSLATSQLDKAKIVDWDMLKSQENENSSMQAWTVGFTPFDFLYGYSMVKHLRTTSGLVAVATYERQTGMKLRKWSAPPVSVHSSKRFRELRQSLGLWKASLEKGRQVLRRTRVYLPKYQQISEEMIKTAPLRIGFPRAAMRIKIHNKPWVLLKELNEYTSKLASRYETYQQYLHNEVKMIQRYRLRGRLTLSDLKMHGISYSAVSFLPKSLFLAIKTGRLKSFFRNFGDIWKEVKSIQGQLIHERVEGLRKIAQKLESFKTQNFYGRHQIISTSKNLMDDFQKLLTVEEILLLEEVAKSSKGYFGAFKQTFKDHKTIVQGLRPMQYLFGHTGESFNPTIHYPQNIIMGDRLKENYTFKNTSEDLVNFYESLLGQNAINSPDLNNVRRQIEEELSRHFIYKSNGERIFFD